VSLVHGRGSSQHSGEPLFTFISRFAAMAERGGEFRRARAGCDPIPTQSEHLQQHAKKRVYDNAHNSSYWHFSDVTNHADDVGSWG
jgi:hypothetical protein